MNGFAMRGAFVAARARTVPAPTPGSAKPTFVRRVPSSRRKFPISSTGPLISGISKPRRSEIGRSSSDHTLPRPDPMSLIGSGIHRKRKRSSSCSIIGLATSPVAIRAVATPPCCSDEA